LETLVNLQELYLSGNQITKIEGLETLVNLQELCLGGNQITKIEGLETLVNLQKLYLGGNQITKIEGLETLVNLLVLFLGYNQIIKIPFQITRLRHLNEFCYDNNPIEEIHPLAQRFIDRINRRNFDTNNIYNDGQNIHDSTIQKCIRESIFRVMESMSADDVTDAVLHDEILTPQSKSLIFEYCEDREPHSILGITFKDLFNAVWMTIVRHPDGAEIKRVLNGELQDAECKCFTGRLSRLVNCLNGFDDRVSIQISDKSQIGNIVIMVKASLERDGHYTVERHREIVRKELQSRNYEEGIIKEFIEYIE